jgi:hypothetical protein
MQALPKVEPGILWGGVGAEPWVGRLFLTWEYKKPTRAVLGCTHSDFLGITGWPREAKLERGIPPTPHGAMSANRGQLLPVLWGSAAGDR